MFSLQKGFFFSAKKQKRTAGFFPFFRTHFRRNTPSKSHCWNSIDTSHVLWMRHGFSRKWKKSKTCSDQNLIRELQTDQAVVASHEAILFTIVERPAPLSPGARLAFQVFFFCCDPTGNRTPSTSIRGSIFCAVSFAKRSRVERHESFNNTTCSLILAAGHLSGDCEGFWPQDVFDWNFVFNRRLPNLFVRDL